MMHWFIAAALWIYLICRIVLNLKDRKKTPK